jgi:hypothetical protein
MAAPVHDTTGSAQVGVSNGVTQPSLTLAATLASGASLAVSVHCARTVDISTATLSCTYNAVSMSAGTKQAPGSNTSFSQMFWLLNCGDGASHNIVATVTAGTLPAVIIIGYESATGVTAFNGSTGSAPGISTNSGNLAVTTDSNGLVYGAGAHGDTTTGVGAGGTNRWNENVDALSSGSNARGGTWAGAGSSVNVAFTSSVSDHWTLIGVNMDGGAGGGGDPTGLLRAMAGDGLRAMDGSRLIPMAGGPADRPRGSRRSRRAIPTQPRWGSYPR